MPPNSRGRPTARPISSLIQAMAVSFVPMSGPGMYSVRWRMAAAKARTSCCLSPAGIDGSPKITDLAPPWASAAALFLNVNAQEAAYSDHHVGDAPAHVEQQIIDVTDF